MKNEKRSRGDFSGISKKFSKNIYDLSPVFPKMIWSVLIISGKNMNYKLSKQRKIITDNQSWPRSTVPAGLRLGQTWVNLVLSWPWPFFWRRSTGIRIFDNFWKPSDAINIIECDMNVDFEAPVGYVEPERPAPPTEEPS